MCKLIAALKWAAENYGEVDAPEKVPETPKKASVWWQTYFHNADRHGTKMLLALSEITSFIYFQAISRFLFVKCVFYHHATFLLIFLHLLPPPLSVSV